MTLHISFWNARIAAALHDHLVKRIARLERIAAEILVAHVFVPCNEHAATRNRYCFEAHRAVARPDIHARSDGSGLCGEIDQIGDKLASQLWKRETRPFDHRRSLLYMEGRR